MKYNFRMAFSFSFLSRYRSAIVAVTAIVAGCTILYIQTADSSPSSSSASVTSTSQHSGLHRSNAQRRRRRRRRHDQLSSETDRRSGDTDETDGQSGQAVDSDVRNPTASSPEILPPGAFVANYFTQPTALTNSSTHEPRAEEDLTTEHELMSEDSVNEERPGREEEMNRLHLLYRMAEEQATREGYIHRGINCSSCNQLPIRGIRFRCANCSDYDLCEQCEANEAHIKTHVFLKIKVPIPYLGNPGHTALPAYYPGRPTYPGPQRLSFSVVAQYAKEHGLTHAEVEALWDQFLCLASQPSITGPVDDIHAITRRAFDKCFISTSAIQSAATNIIFDRMFDFYDTDRDGVISFSEFLSGIACLTKPSKANERLRRIFSGYDFDENGLVDRKDFLRMFRAYYAMNKELTKEMITGWGNEISDDELIMGSHPISSGFAGTVGPNARLRAGEGKRRDENGDYVIQDGGGILREPSNDTGDRNEVLADIFETISNGNLVDAEHRELEDSMLAEQIPEAERDVGREVIYQVTQQAYNELLDPLFKQREGYSLAALCTVTERQRAQKLLDGTSIVSDLPSVSQSTDYHQEIVHTQGSSKISEPAQNAMPSAPNPEHFEQTPDFAFSEEAGQPRPDPTLPQYRPNSAPLKSELRAAPSSTHSATLETTPVSSGDPSGPPFPPLNADRLSFLRHMNFVEEEDKRRGGPGRISFDEFREVVTGPAAAEMGFVGAWVDMAVF